MRIARRRLPPPISPEELTEKTNQVLKEKGAENYIQSLYYRQSTSLLLSNNSPIFNTYKPQLRIKKEREWKTAMAFCIAYLTKFNQRNTLQTIVEELQSYGVAFDASQSDPSIIRYMNKVVRKSRKTKLPPFEIRVQEYLDIQEQEDEKSTKNTTLVQAPKLELPAFEQIQTLGSSSNPVSSRNTAISSNAKEQSQNYIQEPNSDPNPEPEPESESEHEQPIRSGSTYSGYYSYTEEEESYYTDDE